MYCHFDGYLSYVGQILFDNYNTEEKVKELISHGDMSCIAEKIEPDPSREHKFDGEQQDDVCLYYHRDRGEEWEHTKPTEADSEKEYYDRIEQEYNYLFKDGKWYWRTCGEKAWKELTEEEIRKAS